MKKNEPIELTWKTLYFVAKHKPWRDRDDEYRLRSPEFPTPYRSWTAARRAIRTRKQDGAKCVIVFQQVVTR